MNEKVESMKIFLASSKNTCVSGSINIVFQLSESTMHIDSSENVRHNDMFM